MPEKHPFSSGFLDIFHEYSDSKSCPYKPVVHIVKGKLLKPNLFRAIITDSVKIANAVISPLPVDSENKPIIDLFGYVIQMDSWVAKVSTGKVYFCIKKLQLLCKAEPSSLDELPWVLPHNQEENQEQEKEIEKEPELKQDQKSETKPAQKQNSTTTKPSQIALAQRNNSNPIQQSEHYTLISDLTPYQQKWKIRVRLLDKSSIRKFRSGQGELFSVTFIDESGEISALGFTEAVKDFYELLKPTKVYIISNASVAVSNKRFNPNYKYEIKLIKGTVIKECDDADDVPEFKANFVPLDHLVNVLPDSIIDVLGVVHSIGTISTFTSRNGNELVKREISLVDSSKTSILLSLWNNDAETFDMNLNGTVIAAKGVKVSDFNGRSLSLFFRGQIILQPNVPEARKLDEWYKNGGKDSNYTSPKTGVVSGESNKKEARIHLAEAFENKIGQSGLPEYFNAKATVSYISSSYPFYPSCVTEGCFKKVQEDQELQWTCDSCNETMLRPIFRYILNYTISDFTGSMWVTSFNDAGEIVLGMTANELHKLAVDEDEKAQKQYSRTLSAQGQQEMVFKIRAEKMTVLDETKIRNRIMTARPINYADEFDRVVSLINMYG